MYLVLYVVGLSLPPGKIRRTSFTHQSTKSFHGLSNGFLDVLILGDIDLELENFDVGVFLRNGLRHRCEGLSIDIRKSEVVNSVLGKCKSRVSSNAW